MIEPSKGAFYNPTPWEDNEAFLVIGTQDNLEMKAAMVCHPIQELATIATINPDETQLLAGTAQVSEQETGSIAVLDRGCGDNHRQQQSHCVNKDMTFRAIDLFACVITPSAAERCRLNTLAVHATSSWMLVTARTLPHLCPQRVMEPLPCAIIAPLPKVGVDALPLGILFREHPPLDATNCNVQDAVDDQPHIQSAGSSTRFGRWDQWLDNFPLAVGQIGWV